MPTFPTLSVLPSYPLKDDAEDPTLKSNFEAGYTLARTRFTRQRKLFSLVYNKLPNADKLLLEAFCDTVHGGADTFTWTHPITSVSYTVRFDKRPSFEVSEYSADVGYVWDTSFLLVQQ